MLLPLAWLLQPLLRPLQPLPLACLLPGQGLALQQQHAAQNLEHLQGQRLAQVRCCQRLEQANAHAALAHVQGQGVNVLLYGAHEGGWVGGVTTRPTAAEHTRHGSKLSHCARDATHHLPSAQPSSW